MFLDSGGFANAYQGGIRQGGAFELKQVTWAYESAMDSPEVAHDPLTLKAMKAVDIRAWFARMPWKKGRSPLSLAPEYEDYVYDQWRHGRFDAYWKQMGLYAEGFYDAFSDAPMVHMSSWYDPYPRTATQNYMGLSRRKKSPVRLILGPWTHGDRSLTYAGDVDFGAGGDNRWQSRARFPHPSSALVRLLAQGRRQRCRAGTCCASVRHGRRRGGGAMQRGEWITAAAGRAERDWPIPDTRNTAYYLHGDGRLALAPPAAGAAPLTYDYDPDRPVPTIGGTVTSGKPVMVGGAFDQREGPRFFGSHEPYLPLAARPRRAGV